jgi:tRNA A37 methylthiotransferase MiaB
MVKNLTVDYANKFIDKVLNVLIERKIDDFFSGKSENYLEVRIKTNLNLLPKEIYQVKVESVNQDGSVNATLVV